MSVPETHMSAGIFIRTKGDLEVLLVRIEYPDGGHAWKPLSGVSLPEDEGNPLITLERVVSDRGGFDVGNTTPLIRVTRHFDADSGNDRGPHTQWWFLTDGYQGYSLRRTEIKRDGKTIGIPMWIPVREALGNEGDRVIAGTHREALEFAVEVFWFLRGGRETVS